MFVQNLALLKNQLSSLNADYHFSKAEVRQAHVKLFRIFKNIL